MYAHVYTDTYISQSVTYMPADKPVHKQNYLHRKRHTHLHTDTYLPREGDTGKQTDRRRTDRDTEAHAQKDTQKKGDTERQEKMHTLYTQRHTGVYTHKTTPTQRHTRTETHTHFLTTFISPVQCGKTPLFCGISPI